MTVAGTAQVPQTVKVKDLGGLPTNGVVTVGAYGILDIVPTELPPIHGSGVSGGKAEIVVQTNGLLRLSQERAFSSYRQIIRLQGGDWETGHGFEYDERADKHFYANDLTLADGACVSGLPVRVGFRAYYPAWRVLGAAPSVCHAPVIAFKTPLDSGKETFFQLYVEDVTGDAAADFIMNGRINLYSGSDDFDEITLVKAGDGCVLQNGASELVMPTEIKRGAWIFGRSGVSEGAQEFRLEGETTLGLAAAVSNGLAKVVVNAPAKFSFGKDSLLTLDALELADGASLALEGAFGKRSLHVAAEVTEDVLARISCAEGDVFQDEAGYIRAEPKPFLMLIR